VPYIVKPNDDGSSLGGLYLVKDLDAPPPTITEERDIYLVEEYIPGRELTTSVLGDRALATSQFEIGDLYDYSSKYEYTHNNHILPAPLPTEIEEYMLDLAVATHQAIGCRGLTRTDFRWDETRGADRLYILEINTHPGFRRDSNSGEHAAYCGIEFPQLCEWLIQDASLHR
jgi:D-alanine-D-alanine ligase